MQCCLGPNAVAASGISAGFVDSMTTTPWAWNSTTVGLCQNASVPAAQTVAATSAAIQFSAAANLAFVTPLTLNVLPRCIVITQPANITVFVSEWFILTVSLSCPPNYNTTASLKASAGLGTTSWAMSPGWWNQVWWTETISAPRTFNVTALGAVTVKAMDVVIAGASAIDFDATPRTTSVNFTFVANQMKVSDAVVRMASNFSLTSSFTISAIRAPFTGKQFLLTVTPSVAGILAPIQALTWNDTSAVDRVVTLQPMGGAGGNVTVTFQLIGYGAGYLAPPSVLVVVPSMLPVVTPTPLTPVPRNKTSTVPRNKTRTVTRPTKSASTFSQQRVRTGTVPTRVPETSRVRTLTTQARARTPSPENTENAHGPSLGRGPARM